jgi:hypothetical protein
LNPETDQPDGKEKSPKSYDFIWHYRHKRSQSSQK